MTQNSTSPPRDLSLPRCMPLWKGLGLGRNRARQRKLEVFYALQKEEKRVEIDFFSWDGVGAHQGEVGWWVGRGWVTIADCLFDMLLLLLSSSPLLLSSLFSLTLKGIIFLIGTQ